MANQIENGQLELSAEELREFTDWPDPLIEEFLSLVRGVVEITQTINIVVEEISVAGGGIAFLASRLKNLSGQVHNLENATSLSKVNSKLRSLEGEVNALQNSESQNPVNPKLRSIEGEVKELQENASLNPVNAKLRQLARQVYDLENATSLDNFNRASRALAKRMGALENAGSLDKISPNTRLNSRKIGDLLNTMAGLLSQLMQERSQRLELERILPAQIMARVMINT